MFYPREAWSILNVRLARSKVIMRKVVICALDLNVLSCYSLHEQGWETRLGTFEGQWFVSQEDQISSERRKGNGPQDMEIDHVGTVQSSLSSKPVKPRLL